MTMYYYEATLTLTVVYVDIETVNVSEFKGASDTDTWAPPNRKTPDRKCQFYM